MTGIRVEGFVFGMAAVAAHLTSFEGNAAVDNEEYGIAAFDSNSITMADNVVSGSGEAGLYVGDSAHANLTMTGNETFGNRYGIFLRDSQNGDVTGNLIHDNCVGILNIDFPGSANAGHYRIAENEIHDNSALCPGEESGDPPLSGVGVLIVNADRDRVEDNVISTNRPARSIPFHGGVVLIDLDRSGALEQLDHVQRADPEPSERALRRLGPRQRLDREPLRADLLATERATSPLMRGRVRSIA